MIGEAAMPRTRLVELPGRPPRYATRARLTRLARDPAAPWNRPGAGPP